MTRPLQILCSAVCTWLTCPACATGCGGPGTGVWADTAAAVQAAPPPPGACPFSGCASPTERTRRVPPLLCGPAPAPPVRTA